METREYLSQIRRYDHMIDNKLKEIENLRSIICGTSARSIGERVQTSCDRDKISSAVSKIVDMENEVDALIDKRYDIVQQIESIPDVNMYDVLAKRFILGVELKAIRLDGIDSLKQVKRIFYNALDKFESMYGKSYLQE